MPHSKRSPKNPNWSFRKQTRAGCFCCAPPHGAGTIQASSGKNPLQTTPDQSKSDLRLKDFKPHSMLSVPKNRIERPRFPVIDAHTHLTWSREVRNGVSVGEEIVAFAKPEDLLPVMDRKGIRTLVNLTGGVGKGLEQSIQMFDRAAPGRFLTLTEPSYTLFPEPDYAQRQGEAIEHARRIGAGGLKLLKTLGLYLRERIDDGPLVAVDDRRFDTMWETCAAHDMPVFLHVSDPEAFFLPTDEHNERYEELSNHPDWSFYGPEFPSNREIIDARDRMIARHPKTTFALMHVGNGAENLAAVAACLDRFPNTMVDISARIGELGRQPRTAKRFIDRYQDRILFGTDAVPSPTATTCRNSCSATSCTKSIIVFWKPRTSTSTMHRPMCPPRVAGPFMVWGYQTASFARYTMTTPPNFYAYRHE